MKKRISVEECFFHSLEEYSQKDIYSLKKQKEILLIKKAECEEHLKNRVAFKDYVFIWTLLAAIYKVWDMEKEFYSLPFINSPSITLFVITFLISLVFLVDYLHLRQIIKKKQFFDTLLRGINYCLENNLYHEENNAEYVPDKVETEETAE